MTGSHKSKKALKVKAYIHKRDEETSSKVIHIDIEGLELAKIIKPGETTFCGGKKGGIFIGLKSDMQKRAKRLVQ
ncbi:MAG: hypothetical protein GOV02_00665 [Candidatus Aenigmarchaeota archaeon]|nr:hypothetical protein [Candidatus Aenigmarchaeota archaeon]